PGGDILDVAGLQMKADERATGQRLASSSVKINRNHFLIGLSGLDIEARQNLQLLRERPWLDILFVFSGNNRAVLSIAKGQAGEKALAEAMTQWAATPSASNNPSTP